MTESQADALRHKLVTQLPRIINANWLLFAAITEPGMTLDRLLSSPQLKEAQEENAKLFDDLKKAQDLLGLKFKLME